MTERRTASSNENGDVMQKPTRKLQTVILGTIVVLVIMTMNSGIFGIGGETRKTEEDSREYAALEQALMEIEGVGEVALYFHYEHAEAENPLSDYFSLSSSQGRKQSDPLRGVLVVAEGAKEPGVQNALSKILSTVLQLPEHRIVIVEMKKRGNMDEEQ